MISCLFNFFHLTIHTWKENYDVSDIVMLPASETRAETLKHSETFSSHLVGPNNLLVAWLFSCRHFTILFW
jgi:hypothetical protein